MSRPLRIEWPGGLYHVTSRVDQREAIVENDADRRAWLRTLGETCERVNWSLHAECLMPHHDSLLLETPQANLSSGMRHSSGVWLQTFNRRHGRVGHVFQGRYKTIIKRPLAEWQAANHPRDQAMALVFGSGQYRHREISEFFGVHKATVSRAVRVGSGVVNLSASRRIAPGGFNEQGEAPPDCFSPMNVPMKQGAPA